MQTGQEGIVLVTIGIKIIIQKLCNFPCKCLIDDRMHLKFYTRETKIFVCKICCFVTKVTFLKQYFMFYSFFSTLLVLCGSHLLLPWGLHTELFTDE